MQLQRSYTLPNCTITLEGMSDPSAGPNLDASMTILAHAVCQFLGQDAPLSGGREFFTHLVTTVNAYAQEQLSGLRSRVSQTGLVRMKRLENGLHELAVYGAQEERSPRTEPTQVTQLSAVQLFDLVEAVDQFLADGTVLPDLQLPLLPLSKQDVPSQVPVAQRVAAPALGVAGVAIASAVLLGLPVPEINRPRDVAGLEASPPEDLAKPNSETNAEGDMPRADPLDAQPRITDADVLAEIQAEVERNLNDAWTESLGLDESLDYRVSVDQNGKIVGYEGLDERATDLANQTPLLDLLYLPPADVRLQNEPLAQFRVTFTPDDQLEVVPFTTADLGSNPSTPELGANGGDEQAPQTTPPQAAAVPTTLDPPASAPGLVKTQVIRDEAAIARLNETLYNRIDTAWQQTPSFEQPLEYRVQISDQGEVVGFEPLTPAARTYGSEIPLETLKQGAARPESVAEFKAVFQANGVLEVSPWDGF